MKKITFIGALLFMISIATIAQKHPPIRIPNLPATITVQAGTKYFNAKYKAHAWLGNTPGKGLTLYFSTDANVTSATLELTDKAPYHDGSGTIQTTTFGKGVKTYSFYLDSPAYKGHKAYILNLIIPAIQADAGLYWGCLVVRK